MAAGLKSGIRTDRGRSRIQGGSAAGIRKKYPESVTAGPPGIRRNHAAKAQARPYAGAASAKGNIRANGRGDARQDTVTGNPGARSVPGMRREASRRRKPYHPGGIRKSQAAAFQGSASRQIPVSGQTPETRQTAASGQASASGGAAASRPPDEALETARLQKKEYQRQKNVRDMQKKKASYREYAQALPEQASDGKPIPGGASQTSMDAKAGELKAKLNIRTQADTEGKLQKSYTEEKSRREERAERLAESRREESMQASRTTEAAAQLFYGWGRKKRFGEGRGESQWAYRFLKNKRRAKKKFQRAYAAAKIIGEQQGEETGDAARLVWGMASNVASAFLKLLLKLAICGVPVILISLVTLLFFAAAMVIMAVSGVSTAAGSPQAYFEGAFAGETALFEQETYVDDKLQEKYNSFSEEIAEFLAKDTNNKVVYASGASAYHKNSVLAVYFSKLCTDAAYDNCYNRRNAVSREYPQYLLVDTSMERNLLAEVFGQMNYTKTETVPVQLPPETEGGEPQVTYAQQMTVFSLSISEWQALHSSYLSGDGKDLLEELKEYETAVSGGSGTEISGTPAVALESITIPEGADQSLIYMAGFLEAEAGNQTDNNREGQRAVAYVMLNRAGGNINNIIPVLLAPYQFSCYIPYHTVEAKIQKYASMTEEQRNADPIYSICVQASQGQCENPIGSWKYYCNPAGCQCGPEAQWAKIRAKNADGQYKQIQDHVFCQNCW